MKKLLVVFSLLAIFIIGASSCKKCVTCYYKYKNLDDSITVNFPENCDKNKDKKLWKDKIRTEANLHGVDLICSDNKN